jgi:hypothetical protein
MPLKSYLRPNNHPGNNSIQDNLPLRVATSRAGLPARAIASANSTIRAFQSEFARVNLVNNQTSRYETANTFQKIELHRSIFVHGFHEGETY